jgi:hypothetical protein
MTVTRSRIVQYFPQLDGREFLLGLDAASVREDIEACVRKEPFRVLSWTTKIAACGIIGVSSQTDRVVPVISPLAEPHELVDLDVLEPNISWSRLVCRVFDDCI